MPHRVEKVPESQVLRLQALRAKMLETRAVANDAQKTYGVELDKVKGQMRLPPDASISVDHQYFVWEEKS